MAYNHAALLTVQHFQIHASHLHYSVCSTVDRPTSRSIYRDIPIPMNVAHFLRFKNPHPFFRPFCYGLVRFSFIPVMRSRGYCTHHPGTVFFRHFNAVHCISPCCPIVSHVLVNVNPYTLPVTIRLLHWPAWRQVPHHSHPALSAYGTTHHFQSDRRIAFHHHGQTSSLVV